MCRLGYGGNDMTERNLKLCEINYHAAKLAEAAIVSYWVEYDHAKGMHMTNLRDAYARITELMEALE